jgi:hypothetical protein
VMKHMSTKSLFIEISFDEEHAFSHATRRRPCSGVDTEGGETGGSQSVTSLLVPHAASTG